MKAGKERLLVFVLPFTKMVSNYVRAQCLVGYQSDGWNFKFIQGAYPKFFNYFILRAIYRYWYYLDELITINCRSELMVAYFIKPQSPFLLFIARRLLKIKVIVDVNDPYHLPELLGSKTTKSLFNNANWLVFESKEYYEYWSSYFGAISSIVSDTAQREYIYINLESREKSIIWIGSPKTSVYLVEFMEFFKKFNECGYKIKLLGAGDEVLVALKNLSIEFISIPFYDNSILAHQLESSLISFVPMPDDELFNLRGNLKAKISMGYGCLVIASRNLMHERLINDKDNGFLFNTYKEFENIMEIIEDRKLAASVAFNGNKWVADKYSRKQHAAKLIKIANFISRN